MRHTAVNRPFPLVAAALAGALLLAACGGSDDGDGGVGGGGAADTTTLSQMFSTDFEPACRNNPVAGATPYDPTRTGIHKLVLLDGASVDELSEGFLDIPTEWTILFDAATDQYATAELVVCSIRITTTLVQECTGYQTDGVDTGNVVQLYSADYDVSVHAATTGAELGRTTVSAIGTECPSSCRSRRVKPRRTGSRPTRRRWLRSCARSPRPEHRRGHSGLEGAQPLTPYVSCRGWP